MDFNTEQKIFALILGQDYGNVYSGSAANNWSVTYENMKGYLERTYRGSTGEKSVKALEFLEKYKMPYLKDTFSDFKIKDMTTNVRVLEKFINLLHKDYLDETISATETTSHFRGKTTQILEYRTNCTQEELRNFSNIYRKYYDDEDSRRRARGSNDVEVCTEVTEHMNGRIMREASRIERYMGERKQTLIEYTPDGQITNIEDITDLFLRINLNMFLEFTKLIKGYVENDDHNLTAEQRSILSQVYRYPRKESIHILAMDGLSDVSEYLTSDVLVESHSHGFRPSQPDTQTSYVRSGATTREVDTEEIHREWHSRFIPF